MILGKPVNLWLGAATAAFNLIVLALGAISPPIVIPPEVVAAANVTLAAIITLVAYQPPTVQSGSEVKVVTPEGQANKTVTVS